MFFCPDWNTRLLSVSSDGARNMTGRNAGVITHFGNALSKGYALICVYCGAHQLDLVMQHVMSSNVKKNFYSVMMAFIFHLGRQQPPKASMEATCPRVVNRWLSTDKVTRWLKNKPAELMKHIEDKKLSSTPPDLWRVYLLAIECFEWRSDKEFRKIQGLTTLLSQKSVKLDCLVSNYIDEIGAIGPLTDQAVSKLDISEHVVSGWLAVALPRVRDFTLGLASRTDTIITTEIDENTISEMLRDIGMAFFVACNRISKILVQKNEDHSALDGPSSLPPVLPHELVQVSATYFLHMARHQATRLETFYDSQKIHAVADQHKELLRAYHNERVIRAALDGSDGTMSFEVSWGLLGTRFPDFCEFCSGVATLFLKPPL